METRWDYTELAAFYDKRPGYAAEAVERLLAATQTTPDQDIVDVGAGTGKLAIPLAHLGYQVVAVEPNDAMRRFGTLNSQRLNVRWVEGTGEATTLEDASAHLVTFGSSFNVTDRHQALKEAARVLAPGGHFACMWNHIDLEDALQKDVEQIIRDAIPNYDFGARREDPAAVIDRSELFEPAKQIETRFDVEVSSEDYVDTWRAHASLARQAGNEAHFMQIIHAIEARLAPALSLRVPYLTCIWYARKPR